MHNRPNKSLVTKSKQNNNNSSNFMVSRPTDGVKASLLCCKQFPAARTASREFYYYCTFPALMANSDTL